MKRTVGGFGVDFYFNDAFSTVFESNEFMKDIVVHGRMFVVMKKLIHPKEFSPVLSFKSIFSLERSIFCLFLRAPLPDCILRQLLCSMCTLVVVQCVVLL